jgi:hypothetical protein
MTQWHPIFGHLLRAVLQEFYDIQTNVPVGDLPREADILVLRRASTSKPPFRTLWRHLSRWNILELKGRSESARVADIDLLVEVSLGIHRRLQEKEAHTRVSHADVSLWYLANHLGKRFLHDVIQLTGELEPVGLGLWRGRILGRPLWFVSNRDEPIDRESASVHMVSDQSVEQTRELARVVIASEEMWESYGAWLGALYPNQWKEFEAMATKRYKGDIDFDFILEKVGGILKVIDGARAKELVEGGGAKKVVDKIGIDGLLTILSPEQRRELVDRIASGKK